MFDSQNHAFLLLQKALQFPSLTLREALFLDQMHEKRPR